MILIATYNGMSYIREQLQSILRQDYPDLRLLVHDDGSTDGTVEEIRRAAERYPDKVVFIEDGITFKDAKKNFEHLLKMAEADYIFLADQDDIWLPSKSSMMVRFLKEGEKEYGRDTPILAFCDCALVDSQGHVLSSSMSDIWNIEPHSVTLELLLTRNVVCGCASCFNRRLLELALPIPCNAFMHDSWLALVASAIGKIIFVPPTLVLYRQHQKNTIGVQRTKFSSTLLRYVSAPEKAISSFRELGRAFINQAKELRYLLENLGFKNSRSYLIVSEYIDYRTGPAWRKVRYFSKFRKDSFLKEL